MAQIPLEVLELELMASGHRSLRLTRAVSWQDFEPYAKALIGLLNGEVVHQADSPVERVWTIAIGSRRYWLSFDDFGLGISLDPCDAAASDQIENIRQWILICRVTE
jgi:hypothetical protein